MSSPAISVQLYSVYHAQSQDLDGTLAKLAAIGLTNIEAFDFVSRADSLRAALEANGLAAPTAHARLLELDADTPDGALAATGPAETFEAAAALGVQLLIDPYVAPARWGTEDQVRQTADQLNELSAKAADYGLRLGYHNHEHEFTSIIGGRPALEVFADLLDESVRLEVDLYWATAGGADAPSLLGRLGDRVRAVHVKDGPMRTGITAASMPQDQAPAGQGDVPLTQTLAAGTAIEYAVIEFDHYAGDIFDGIAASYAFLSGLLATSDSGDEQQ